MKQYPKYKDSGVSWIGEIPEGWTAVPIYAIAKNFSKGQGITKDQVYEDGDTPCVRYGEIYSKYDNSFAECLSKTKLTEISNPSYFEYGDVLFAGTGELIEEIGKSIVYLGKEKCLAGGDIIVMKHNQTPEFLSYCLNSSAVQQQKSYGKTKLKVVHISKDKIKRVVIALPPLSEQHAIVSYLDKKTAQIDRFISEGTKEIEKLNELKQAQIAHMVTHGLNPDAPMKDSGIAWIGQIPEHWKKARYKDVLSIQDEKVGKRKDLTLLSLTKQGVIIRDLTEMKGKFPKDFESYKVVHPDNIILCLFDVDETPRTVGLSHNEGMITGAYDVFSIKNIDKEYFLYHYLSLDDRKAMKPLYKGLRKTIPLPRLMGEHIFIPPASEQKAIVSAINSLNNKIETLASELTTQIDHLKELKQRIISDAVTGKIDVREVNN